MLPRRATSRVLLGLPLLLLASCRPDLPPAPEEVWTGPTAAWQADFESSEDTVARTVNVADAHISNGMFVGIAANIDPKLFSPELRVHTSKVLTIEVRMKASVRGMVSVYFITDEDTTWNRDKMIRVQLYPGAMKTLVFDPHTNANFRGSLKRIRLDPVAEAGATFEIDFVRILA